MSLYVMYVVGMYGLGLITIVVHVQQFTKCYRTYAVIKYCLIVINIAGRWFVNVLFYSLFEIWNYNIGIIALVILAIWGMLVSII